jgi:hypothetical protein
MRLSIRTKQVLGVTALVTAVVIGLSVQGMAQLASVRLQETKARADLLAHAIYQRSFQVVPGAADPYAALAADGGLRAMLESSLYSPQVTDAASSRPTAASSRIWTATGSACSSRRPRGSMNWCRVRGTSNCGVSSAKTAAPTK